MHDSKNQLSVQKLIETLASTFQTMYTKDKEYLDSFNHPGDEDQDTSKGSKPDEPDDEHLELTMEDFPWLTRWHGAFWETLCREWSRIDQWRMNKYLLLIRFVVREIFRLVFAALSDEDADCGVLGGILVFIFQQYPLSPSERKVPDGMRLHVLDVWVEELQKAKNEAEQREHDGGDGDSRKRKRDQHDDAGKNDNDEEDEEGEDKEEVEEEKEEDDDDGEGNETEEQHPPPPPEKKQSAHPQLQARRGDAEAATQRERLEERLMEPIRSLAKDSISKSVRTKAKEIIKMYDE